MADCNKLNLTAFDKLKKVADDLAKQKAKNAAKGAKK
jgi:hypothetical protein